MPGVFLSGVRVGLLWITALFFVKKVTLYRKNGKIYGLYGVFMDLINRLKNRFANIKFNRKVFNYILFGVSVLFVLAMSVAIFGIIWMYRGFGNSIKIADFLFQIGTLEGTGTGDTIRFVLGVLLPALLYTGALVFIFFFLKKKQLRAVHIWKWSVFLTFVALWLVFIFAIKWLGVDDYFGFAGFKFVEKDDYVPPVIEEIVLPEVEEGGDVHEPGPYDDLQNKLVLESTPWEKGASRDFIESYYVDPSQVQIDFPEEKRNLVYIYLESMEMTFAEKEIGGAFDVSVIPRLAALSEENENFSGSYGEGSLLDGGYSYNGGTWTMGAIFSQTSGLPLQTGSIGQNDMDTQSVFYPSITSMGDILNEAGYRQIFMCGSYAGFGGRQLYFKGHGNYEIRDIGWAKSTKRLPGGYYVWWGFEDCKLFEYAKETLTELGEGDEPFNFTVLTVDTHRPGGYRCELCGNEFPDRYSNVYMCSDKQVSEFVEWIKQQDFYENTTIVIVGDHPTMDTEFCRNIEKDYVRRVYTCIINSPVSPVRETYRSYSTLDMFPTTITALGAYIHGGRLGLGTSLYTNQRTLTEELGYTTVHSSLARFSSFLDSLADIVPVDESGNSVVISDDGTVTITDPDGNVVIMYPDGTQVVIPADGTQTVVPPGTAPDGTTVQDTPATN